MIEALVPQERPVTRCVCCGARARAVEPDGWLRCTWCDLAAHPETGLSSLQIRSELREMITLGAVLHPTELWRAPLRTLRIAATTLNMWLDDGTFTPFAEIPPVTVSLVILARPKDLGARALVSDLACHFHEVVIMEDTPEAPPRVARDHRVISHPLEGDFAAQRNRGNVAATGEWVLHLDTDERVDHAFCDALPHLAGAAQSAGIDTVGFPRRNHVDGQLSDLFPDIQYRLMRRGVRFAGRVHERPIPCEDGSGTVVSQHGAIDHYLGRARVAARSAQYDRLGQSADRHGDDKALLRAFAP